MTRKRIVAGVIAVWLLSAFLIDIQYNQGRGRGYQPKLRLRLITLTEIMIILDIINTESNKCFVIHRTKTKWRTCFCLFTDGKQHRACEPGMIILENHALPSYMTWLPVFDMIIVFEENSVGGHSLYVWFPLSIPVLSKKKRGGIIFTKQLYFQVIIILIWEQTVRVLVFICLLIHLRYLLLYFNLLKELIKCRE